MLEKCQPARAAKSNAICEQHRQGHQSRAVLGKALSAQTFRKVFLTLKAILQVSQLDETSTRMLRNPFLIPAVDFTNSKFMNPSLSTWTQALTTKELFQLPARVSYKAALSLMKAHFRKCDRTTCHGGDT